VIPCATCGKVPSAPQGCRRLHGVAWRPVAFPYGRIYVTEGLDRALPFSVVARLIGRHLRGDWGEAPAAYNEQALVKDEVLYSVYNVGKNRVLIATNWNRSETNALLFNERWF